MKKLFLMILIILLTFSLISCKGETIDKDHFTWKWFLAMNQEDKYGFLDETGKEVIPFIYDEAEPFYYGHAIVRIDDLYGVIDFDGEYILEPNYRSIDDFNALFTDRPETGEYFKARETDGTLSVFNTNGKNILSIDGVVNYEWLDYEDLFRFTEDGLYGIVDTSGKYVLDCIYEGISPFSEGLAVFKKEDKYGYVNVSGEIIIENTYDDATDFKNGIASVKTDELWSAINQEEEVLFDQQFPIYFNFNEEGNSIIQEKALYGIIDSEGNIVLEPINILSSTFAYYDLDKYTFYDGEHTKIMNPSGLIKYQTDQYSITNFSDEVILVNDSGNDFQNMVINYEGEVIVPLCYNKLVIVPDVYGNSLIYEEISSPDIDGTVVVNVYNVLGELVCNSQTISRREMFYNYEKEVILIKSLTTRNYALIDYDGDIKVELDFDTAVLCPDYIHVSNEGLYGICDYQGNIIVALEYESIFSYGILYGYAGIFSGTGTSS